ncbi:hypothetical protein CEXT_175841, partial [Caerostris extrusa]
MGIDCVPTLLARSGMFRENDGHGAVDPLSVIPQRVHTRRLLQDSIA